MTYLQQSYEDSLKEIVTLKYKLEQAEKTLKLIANGNNEFPTWGDTVDILKDVRSIARETLKSIQGEDE